jgi:uncharacterized protein (DUF433 family)
MVEGRLLAEFRNQRVPVRRLRPALERLRAEFGAYPLGHARILLEVEGQDLARRVQDEIGLEPQLVVVRNGQLMLDLRPQRFADAVQYSDGVAATIRPITRTPDVQLDPNRSFGQPSIRGVRTEVLAEEYRAGESRESLADLYDLDPEQVDQALRYELPPPRRADRCAPPRDTTPPGNWSRFSITMKNVCGGSRSSWAADRGP